MLRRIPKVFLLVALLAALVASSAPAFGGPSCTCHAIGRKGSCFFDRRFGQCFNGSCRGSCY